MGSSADDSQAGRAWYHAGPAIRVQRCHSVEMREEGNLEEKTREVLESLNLSQEAEWVIVRATSAVEKPQGLLGLRTKKLLGAGALKQILVAHKCLVSSLYLKSL